MIKKKIQKNQFSTAPVFLAAISTILGAVLFLRFGYAVGNVGVFGTILIIAIGHAITIPTAMAVAEIATNLKVEGGGEYYIISRSFGGTIGGAIGISLYFSQAISVAFYMIAFSEAFRPLFPLFESTFHIPADIRFVSIPMTFILAIFIIYKGASMGVGILWSVSFILAISLIMFFLGGSTSGNHSFDFFNHVSEADDFFKVFAIIFPAFTGMTAGVGLSGDLKNPRRSIPLGTLSGTLIGMAVYILVVLKLGHSAPPEHLAGDHLIMSRIALWSPIIFIGLGAATISSAVGSLLVAPRTLQALSTDNVFPILKINEVLKVGSKKSNEPIRATILTLGIVLIFIAVGNIDFVAQIISMFFMVTYGALCLVSFLEHFSGDPSYRPTFHSKWYLSLIGAIASFAMMYLMSPFYATLAIVIMSAIYLWLLYSRKDDRDLSEMIKGVLFQITRKLQILLQKNKAGESLTNWRPSFVALSKYSTSRLAPFDLLRWISHHFGFGSYIHFIEGPLNNDTNNQAKIILEKLVEQTQASGASLYVDTIISPSFKTAVAQIVQIPGISGLDNNSILFEYIPDEDNIENIIEGCYFAAFTKLNICILRSSYRHFGYRKNIHIWLTSGDYRNANLMILLAYIITGHPEWSHTEIELFSAFEKRESKTQALQLQEITDKGRLPISASNIQQVELDKEHSFEEALNEYSESADLVITGFSLSKMQQDKGSFIKSFTNVKDILFVRAGQEILITEDGDASELTG